MIEHLSLLMFLLCYLTDENKFSPCCSGQQVCTHNRGPIQTRYSTLIHTHTHTEKNVWTQTTTHSNKIHWYWCIDTRTQLFRKSSKRICPSNKTSAGGTTPPPNVCQPVRLQYPVWSRPPCLSFCFLVWFLSTSPSSVPCISLSPVSHLPMSKSMFAPVCLLSSKPCACSQCFKKMVPVVYCIWQLPRPHPSWEQVESAHRVLAEIP